MQAETASIQKGQSVSQSADGNIAFLVLRVANEAAHIEMKLSGGPFFFARLSSVALEVA